MDSQRQQLSLLGWGTARGDRPSIDALRKTLPAWAPAGTAGHFLKYADEQTVMAVAALDQAIRTQELPSLEFAKWAIIAAPRFIGRIAGTATLARYSRGGGPAISPHVIPQHSLHSISGALSILLASKMPNFGVGGTSHSLTEGLVASLTFPFVDCQGIWLVATSWEPEPQIDEQGNCINEPVCLAAALAFQMAAPAVRCGTLRFEERRGLQPRSEAQATTETADLCRRLAATASGGPAVASSWSFAGNRIVLEVNQPARVKSLAA